MKTPTNLHKALCVCLMTAAVAVAQGVDPKYKEQHEREFYEAQKKYLLTDTGRANWSTMSATVNKAKKSVIVLSSNISKNFAQLLVNTVSRKVAVQVYTEAASVKQNAYYSQMAKFGIRVLPMKKADFSQRQTVVIVDDAVVFMGEGQSFTFMKGAYPRYMRDTLESAWKMLQ